MIQFNKTDDSDTPTWEVHLPGQDSAVGHMGKFTVGLQHAGDEGYHQLILLKPT